MSAAHRSSLSIVVGVVVALVALAADEARASEAVARCKKADASFDYEAAVQECAIAAADTTTTRDEKILVYQLLGIAHTALKQEDRAETWFMRLLVLDASHELPTTVSPVYLQAFARAKERFVKEGRVTATQNAVSASDATASGGLKVSYRVTDPLGRVQDARMRVRTFQSAAEDGAASSPSVDVVLTRTPGDEPGSFVLSGEVPNPGPPPDVTGSYRIEYRLVLLSPVGEEIAADPPVLPVAFDAEATGEASGSSSLWIGVGAGGAALALVVVAAVGTAAGVAIVCLTTDLCRGEEAPARVLVSPSL